METMNPIKTILLIISIEILYLLQGNFAYNQEDSEIIISSGKSPVTGVQYFKQFGYIHDKKTQTIEENPWGALKEPKLYFHWFIGYDPQEKSDDLDEETIKQMDSLRCGNKDIEDGAEFDAEKEKMGFVINHKNLKWEHDVITYKITQYPGDFPRRKKDIDDLFARAFQTWSINTSLKFINKQESLGGQHIEIKFVRDNHHSCNQCLEFLKNPKSLVGHAYYPSKDNNDQTTGGDIHFNDFIDWSIDEGLPGVSLMGVALHEIGHSLGLSHPPCRKARMFPISNFTITVLDKEDKDGIKKIYPKKIHKKPKNITTTAKPASKVNRSPAAATPSPGTEKAQLPVCGTDDQWWFPGSNCKQYYDCTSGNPVLKECGEGLVWKQNNTWCDFPHNVPGCSA